MEQKTFKDHQQFKIETCIRNSNEKALKIVKGYGFKVELNRFIKKLKQSQIQSSQIIDFLWADTLTNDQLQIIIAQILPKSLKSVSFNGCINITVQNIVSLLKKADNLNELTLYYKGSQAWDPVFYQQGLSAKYFRERSKWSSKIKFNPSNFNEFTQSLTKNLKQLNLKNVRLNQLKNPVQLILKQCPQLSNLDLSNTLLTDNQLIKIQENIIKNFILKIKQLHLNRNRISKTGLFNLLKIIQDKKQIQVYDLKILQINDTIVSEYYSIMSKCFKGIQNLGIGSLQINHSQIIDVHEKQQFVWNNLKQLTINDHIMTLESLNIIMKNVSQLEALTMSNLVIQQQHKSQQVSTTMPTKLTKLNMNSLHFNQINILVYNFVKVSPKINTLKLSSTAISCKLLDRLAQIQNTKSIQYLQISYLQALYVQALPNFNKFKSKQLSLAASCDLAVMYLIQKIVNHMPLIQLQAYGLFMSEQFRQQIKKQNIQNNSECKSVSVLLDQQGMFNWRVSHDKK